MKNKVRDILADKKVKLQAMLKESECRRFKSSPLRLYSCVTSAKVHRGCDWYMSVRF